MAIKPCGHRLVVKAFKQEEVDEIVKKHAEFYKSLEVINSNKKREDASVDRGIVQSIGPTAWADFKDQYGNRGSPWCKVGDEIIFAKFAGKVVQDPETEEDVFVLNDEDVIAVVKEA